MTETSEQLVCLAQGFVERGTAGRTFTSSLTATIISLLH